MIDIHCHIIPGVDDGVPTMEEALALIRKEAEGGTRAFIATPHYIDRRDYDRLRDLGPLIEELASAVKDAGIEVDIHPGGEIFPTMAIFAALDSGAKLTLGGKGKHMLIDLPMGELPRDFDQIIYELQVRGITPVVAHPERNAHFQQNLSALTELLARGAVCQVNSGSLAGRYGPRAKEAIWAILRRHEARFLASDAHRAGGTSILGTARDTLKEELDSDYVELLTEKSANAVLNGDPLPTPPEPVARPVKANKPWLSRLIGR